MVTLPTSPDFLFLNKKENLLMNTALVSVLVLIGAIAILVGAASLLEGRA
jgi:hypothetical protein